MSYPDNVAGWIAELEQRASNCEALWKQEGAPLIDECDSPSGAGYFHVMMAFRRVIKDMKEAMSDAQDRAMAFHNATTCPCVAAERHMPSCPKHGIPAPL